MSLVQRLSRAVDWFIPQAYIGASPDIARRARLTVAFSLTLGCFGPFYTGLYFFVGMPITALGCSAALLVVLTAPLTFRLSGSMGWATTQLLGALTFVLSWVALFSGGIHSGVLPWFASIPVFGLMLGGHRAGWAWTSVVVSIIATLTGADIFGSRLPESELNPAFVGGERGILVVGAILLIALLSGQFESAKHRMLRRVEQAKLEADDARGQAEQEHAYARLVLDNVDQGLLMVDTAGKLLPGHSASVERMFGPAHDHDTLWSYLRGCSDKLGEWLQIGWESIREDELPLELVLDQFPRRTRFGALELALEYVPVGFDDGVDPKILVVISDITSRVEAERASAGQRETVEVIERIVRDRQGVLEFIDEARNILKNLQDETVAPLEQRRLIHTLKGNAGLFGVSTVVDACHILEHRMEDERREASGEEICELVAVWGRFEARVEPLTGKRVRDLVTLDQHEYRAFLEELRRGVDPSTLFARALSWTRETTRERLARLEEHAQSLAQRLGREQLEVRRSDANIRLEPDLWSSFWSSFAHVLRNAIDHGIETPQERLMLGKPPQGRLELRTGLEGDEFVIEIRDDGRGIAWDRVREKAHHKGLPCSTRADLIEALFADGLSTRDTASDVSGRGVGMSAVLASTRALDGRVEVESWPGEGTAFRFVFPATLTTVSIPSRPAA